jgi:hypothetical protein
MGTSTPEKFLHGHKRDAVNQALVSALRDDVVSHGRALVEDLRNCDRAQYVRLCAALLPRDSDGWTFQDLWEEQYADFKQVVEAKRAQDERASGAHAQTATLQTTET